MSNQTNWGSLWKGMGKCRRGLISRIDHLRAHKGIVKHSLPHAFHRQIRSKLPWACESNSLFSPQYDNPLYISYCKNIGTSFGLPDDVILICLQFTNIKQVKAHQPSAVMTYMLINSSLYHISASPSPRLCISQALHPSYMSF
jgi:hypothetical protein